MKISKNAIVSNSEMIKSYKTCRGKAERSGKIFVLRNNRPDAVLFSINEYEKRSELIEQQESLEEKGMAKDTESIPKEGYRKKYTIIHLGKGIK